MDLAALHKPLPELTVLQLTMYEDDRPGTILVLGQIRTTPARTWKTLHFRDYRNLLFFLSATHLVHLSLCDLPCSVYIPPDAMAAGLSSLTNVTSPSVSIPMTLPCPRKPTSADARYPPRSHRDSIQIILHLFTSFPQPNQIDHASACILQH